MHVDVRQAEDVIIVDFEGRLVAGTSGDELLREVMNELVAKDWRKILLNFTLVTHIDSAGVGELVASARLAERFGIVVKVVRGHERVYRVLDVGHILPILDVHDSENLALAAFASGEDDDDLADGEAAGETEADA